MNEPHWLTIKDHAEMRNDDAYDHSHISGLSPNIRHYHSEPSLDVPNAAMLAIEEEADQKLDNELWRLSAIQYETHRRQEDQTLWSRFVSWIDSLLP